MVFTCPVNCFVIYLYRVALKYFFFTSDITKLIMKLWFHSKPINNYFVCVLLYTMLYFIRNTTLKLFLNLKFISFKYF